MKKRYIYSALLSGLLFAIMYIALDFNIFISLLLVIATYIGGIFFFKEKDVRTYNPDMIMHYCYQISKLSNYSKIIKNKEVCKNIKEITDEAEKIIVMLDQKPNKVTQVYDGFDYYLPLTIKAIEQYIYISKKEKMDEQEKKFMNNLTPFLDSIEQEVKKLLENMNYTKMLDINSSIEVFKLRDNIVQKLLKDKDRSEDDA